MSHRPKVTALRDVNRLGQLMVVTLALGVSAQESLLQFIDCDAAGFDHALARAIFAAENRSKTTIEVRCLANGTAQLRRGRVLREVMLTGLSPTLRATTLGLAGSELARETPPAKLQGPEDIVVVLPPVDLADAGAGPAPAPPVETPVATPPIPELAPVAVIDAGTPVPAARFVPVDVALVTPLSVNGAVGGRITNALSFGVLANHMTHLYGLSLSAGGSIIQERLRGMQLSALFGTSSDAVGLQASGVVSHNNGDFIGTQLSAVVASNSGHFSGFQTGIVARNAGALAGLQLGLLNIGEDVDGLQLGLVNIARRVRGVQLGLVNVAQDVTVPVGLVNVVERGQFHVALWLSDSTVANVAVKAGSKHIYGLAVLGWHPWGDSRFTGAVGLGIGGRIGEETGWYSEIEATGHSLVTLARVDNATLGQVLRVNVGHAFLKHFSVFGGAQLQVFEELAPTSGRVLAPVRWVVVDQSYIRVTLAPSLVIGVQL